MCRFHAFGRSLGAALAVLACALPAPAMAAVCRVGELRNPTISVIGQLGPGNSYYTLLVPDPDSCAACPSADGLVVSNGFIRLRFRAGCSLTLEVAIVEATGPAVCPVPDTLHFICPPNQVKLSEPSIQAQGKNYPLPLAQTCCITRPAFLCVKFISSDCGSSDPGLNAISFSSCTPCFQYWTYPGGAGPYDVCDPVDGLGINPKFYVEADCCTPTPARHGTWGEMKVRYR